MESGRWLAAETTNRKQKSCVACHLLASVEDRFRCFEHHQQHFEVHILSRVLEVSVSSFSAWRTRPMCSRKREDGLKEPMVEIFPTHRGCMAIRVFTRPYRSEAFMVGANGWSA